MGVSKNRGGPPKSSILIGFSIINHPFWGTPNFWKHPHEQRCYRVWGPGDDFNQNALQVSEFNLKIIIATVSFDSTASKKCIYL